MIRPTWVTYKGKYALNWFGSVRYSGITLLNSKHLNYIHSTDAIQHGGNDDVVAAIELDVANSAEPAAPIEDVTIHTDLIDDDEMDNGGANVVDNGGAEVRVDMELELNDMPVELEEHSGLYASVNRKHDLS
ncbi:hypothetical protein K7X08_033883 [Anisodus acutangulus]|uniref:Uncharacterized protein n=1 Tax=Anisodus acutangulus TaxID=402998 RepID=A0A9Q1M504_9SOLA|nr:hypothetical protein K7X08_033883 [Anisodus acutangulus]